MLSPDDVSSGKFGRGPLALRPTYSDYADFGGAECGDADFSLIFGRCRLQMGHYFRGLF